MTTLCSFWASSVKTSCIIVDENQFCKIFFFCSWLWIVSILLPSYFCKSEKEPFLSHLGHNLDSNHFPFLTPIYLNEHSNFVIIISSSLFLILFSLSKQNTLLQKLSKCEVEAWLCWNLIILLPLRFLVKSNFGKFIQSKNVIFGNFRGSELWILVNLGLENCSNLLNIIIRNL